MDNIQFLEGIKGERKKNVKNGEIVSTVLAHYRPLLEQRIITQYIKKVFVDMVTLYGEKEKGFAFSVLKPIYDDAFNQVEQEESLNKTISLLEKVYEYDYGLHNSSAQARRNARGYFLESVLSSLFEYYARNQFMKQVKINHDGIEKRIDFIVGTSSIFDASKNLLYVTSKKSLRERAPQVSDEKIFLGTNLLFFFYADDIKKISDGTLKKFYNEDIVMVTYSDTVSRLYTRNKNVISYDKFFLEILPYYLENKDRFKATDFGIETLHQRGAGFLVKRSTHA